MAQICPCPQRLLVKFTIIFLSVPVNLNYPSFRLDTEQVEVEECVNVCSKKESIRCVIVLLASVWRDMGGLENIH